MRKKTYICIVVILILTIFIQIIFFHYRTKKNENKNTMNNNQNYITEDNVKSLKVYPINEDKIFEVYKGSITKDDFEGAAYQILFGIIPWIYKKYSNMTLNEINDYYNQNTIEVNRLYIYSSDDLYLITQQIKNISKDITPMVDYTKIDENSIKNENGYCNFNLDIYFVNSQIVKLKIKLKNSQNSQESNSKGNEQSNTSTAEEEKSLIVEDNSEIQQLYKITNEGFSRSNAIQIIQNIIDNAEKIKNDTYAYSINQEKQYYDLNKEKLNTLGIYSKEDFESFITSVGNISWDSKDRITGYEIDLSNVVKNEDYTSATLYINYGNIERIKLTISVANKINIVPQIKIS